MRPIFVEINLRNLLSNYFIIKNLCLGKNIWLVIKANAYGHGIKNIYFVLYKIIDGFAVIDINEGLLLRKLGFKKPILLLEGFFDYEELILCFKYNFTIVIHSMWQLNIVKKICNVQNKIHVYLKYNHDLHRLGFNLCDFYTCYNYLKDNQYIKSISLMIHLAKSNFDDDKNNYIVNYKKLINMHCIFKDVSFFNSSGSLWHINNVYTTWVRVGILLYGSSPTGDFNDISQYGFKPVMSLKSKIITIRKINAGTGIGYRHHYITKNKKFIAILACGYADGYPKQISYDTPVYINKHFTATVLVVYMDMMVINIMNYKDVFLHSLVELWGSHISIDYVAKLSHTISYSLMCNINHNRVNFKVKK